MIYECIGEWRYDLIVEYSNSKTVYVLWLDGYNTRSSIARTNFIKEFKLSKIKNLPLYRAVKGY